MIKVERIDVDFVLFTDLEKEISFDTDAKEGTFQRLARDPNLKLSEEQCQKLYRAILRYDIIFIEDGMLFKKKHARKIPHISMLSQVHDSKDPMDKLLDRSLECIDDLAGVKKKTEIVGVRYDR